MFCFICACCMLRRTWNCQQMSQQMLWSVTGATRVCVNLKGCNQNVLQLSGIFVGGPQTVQATFWLVLKQQRAGIAAKYTEEFQLVMVSSTSLGYGQKPGWRVGCGAWRSNLKKKSCTCRWLQAPFRVLVCATGGQASRLQNTAGARE